MLQTVETTNEVLQYGTPRHNALLDHGMVLRRGAYCGSRGATMEMKLGKYAIQYDLHERPPSYAVMDGFLALSQHDTLAAAVDAAERYIAGDRRRAKQKIIARIPHREASGDR